MDYSRSVACWEAAALPTHRETAVVFLVQADKWRNEEAEKYTP